MPPPDRTSAISRIRTSMIEKKLTQAELADTADCHEKTIQNLLNGRSVRDQTLFDVCMVLGLDFDEVKREWQGGTTLSEPGPLSPATGVAPAYMGAYTKIAVEHYIGRYVTLRPAFRNPDAITAYRTDIAWDDTWPSLRFTEHDRPDGPFAHEGRLYIPASSMFIHFVSLTKGAMRTITASQLDQTGMMRGVISTLNKQQAQFIPTCAPIVFIRQEHMPAPHYGELRPGQPGHNAYQTLLKETISSGYVRLVGPAPN